MKFKFLQTWMRQLSNSSLRAEDEQDASVEDDFFKKNSYQYAGQIYEKTGRLLGKSPGKINSLSLEEREEYYNDHKYFAVLEFDESEKMLIRNKDIQLQFKKLINQYAADKNPTSSKESEMKSHFNLILKAKNIINLVPLSGDEQYPFNINGYYYNELKDLKETRQLEDAIDDKMLQAIKAQADDFNVYYRDYVKAGISEPQDANYGFKLSYEEQENILHKCQDDLLLKIEEQLKKYNKFIGNTLNVKYYSYMFEEKNIVSDKNSEEKWERESFINPLFLGSQSELLKNYSWVFYINLARCDLYDLPENDELLWALWHEIFSNGDDSINNFTLELFWKIINADNREDRILFLADTDFTLRISERSKKIIDIIKQQLNSKCHLFIIKENMSYKMSLLTHKYHHEHITSSNLEYFRMQMIKNENFPENNLRKIETLYRKEPVWYNLFNAPDTLFAYLHYLKDNKKYIDNVNFFYIEILNKLLGRFISLQSRSFDATILVKEYHDISDFFYNLHKKNQYIIKSKNINIDQFFYPLFINFSYMRGENQANRSAYKRIAYLWIRDFFTGFHYFLNFIQNKENEEFSYYESFISSELLTISDLDTSISMAKILCITMNLLHFYKFDLEIQRFCMSIMYYTENSNTITTITLIVFGHLYNLYNNYEVSNTENNIIISNKSIIKNYMDELFEKMFASYIEMDLNCEPIFSIMDNCNYFWDKNFIKTICDFIRKKHHVFTETHEKIDGFFENYLNHSTFSKLKIFINHIKNIRSNLIYVNQDAFAHKDLPKSPHKKGSSSLPEKYIN